MNKITTVFYRNNTAESIHNIKCIISDDKGRVIYSTGNDNDFIYPRSSIKIFQAIPFILSGSTNKYLLNDKQIALSCASHRGQKFHINELRKWIKKLKINKSSLQCGIHYPLNKEAYSEIVRSKKKINVLYNNCAGKHLAMITSCCCKGYEIENYLDFNHPHQRGIRKVFNDFTESKIKFKNYGVDGCSAPQYSFKMKDLSKALNNLFKSYHNKFHYRDETQLLIKSILTNPKFIGGTDSLDSKIMSISDKKIFCKGGAEGVFLFINLEVGITGIIKVEDGNERALPSVIYSIFKKYKIMNNHDLSRLKKHENFIINNHAKIKVGSIETKIYD